MTKKINLLWKIPIKIDNFDEKQYEKIFHFQTSKSFFGDMGGVSFSNSLFQPTTLTPTINFYNKINKIQEELYQSSKFSSIFLMQDKKFPFRYNSQYIDEQYFNINMKLYSRSLVILTIKLKEFEINLKDNVEAFLALQDLKKHSTLYIFIVKMINLIFRQSNHAISTPKIFPCFLIQRTNEELTPLSEEFIVKVLTRHSSLEKNIIQQVVAKNHIHQLDSNNKILIDKQGIFGINNHSKYEQKNFMRKFLSLHCIFELGIAVSNLLQSKQELSEIMKESISTLIYTPEIIFLNSVTSLKSWELVIGELHLKSLLAEGNINDPKPTYNSLTINIGENIMGNKMVNKGHAKVGNAVIADKLENCFNKISSSNADNDLKVLLKIFEKEASKVLENLDKDKHDEFITDVKLLTDEALKEKPTKKYLDMSVQGILDATKSVGEVGNILLEITPKIAQFFS